MPQIAQQDYLRIDIGLGTLTVGGESNFSNAQVRQLYKWAKARVLNDVEIISDGGDCFTKIIGYSLRTSGDLYIYFADDENSEFGYLNWEAEPDPDDE